MDTGLRKRYINFSEEEGLWLIFILRLQIRRDYLRH